MGLPDGSGLPPRAISSLTFAAWDVAVILGDLAIYVTMSLVYCGPCCQLPAWKMLFKLALKYWWDRMDMGRRQEGLFVDGWDSYFEGSSLGNVGEKSFANLRNKPLACLWLTGVWTMYYRTCLQWINESSSESSVETISDDIPFMKTLGACNYIQKNFVKYSS